MRQMARRKPDSDLMFRYKQLLRHGARARHTWLALALWLGVGWGAMEAHAAPGETGANGNWMLEATNHLGQWIWDTNTFDKQTCRFWKPFEIPPKAVVKKAILHLTVDNGYVLFLDGNEIGRGSDWRSVTEYNISLLLKPGRHILAVEGFNDRLEAGLIFGLHIQFANREPMDVVSDDSWLVVPATVPKWMAKKQARPDWHGAIMEGPVHHHPWEIWPIGLTTGPALQPVVVHFWQTGWFQLALLSLLLLTLAACFRLWTQLAMQARSQKLLQAERIRIARDIHDDLGAQLTQLLLLCEVGQREQPKDSPAQIQFNQLCVLARELSCGMDEVVWTVNARRDTLRDFTSYVCKFATVFLDATPIRCRLDVAPDLPDAMFDLPLRRNLFLAVKEALNNAAKYSSATELFVRIARAGETLVVTVEDNGQGFDPDKLTGERNGMANMAHRMGEINGRCEVMSAPGAGCRAIFTVPLENLSTRGWFNWRRRPAATALEIS